jgi:exonuclease VII large subunit
MGHVIWLLQPAMCGLLDMRFCTPSAAAAVCRKLFKLQSELDSWQRPALASSSVVMAVLQQKFQAIQWQLQAFDANK